MYELDVVDKEEISEQGNYLLQIKISEDDFERFNRDLNLIFSRVFYSKISLLILISFFKRENIFS